MKNIFEPTLDNIRDFFKHHDVVHSELEGEALYAMLINLLKENNPKISWIGFRTLGLRCIG